MKLKLGKMTTAELAAWMGLKPGSFRHNTEKRYKLLEQYCDYEKFRGYIEIKEIYVAEFQGDLESKDIKTYLKEVSTASNNLSSISGIARKLQLEEKEYKDIQFNTIRNRLSKAGKKAFGKTNNMMSPSLYSGPYGSREYVWGVKVSDYNEYRYMTPEEEEYFDMLLESYYKMPAEKIKAQASLDEALKKREIQIDEYFNYKEALGLDKFKEIIEIMYLKKNVIIVHCTRHDIKEKSVF